MHGQPGDHGFEVGDQSAGEAGDPGQLRVAGGADPVRQVSTRALGEYPREVADEFVSLLQLWAGVEHRLELLAFVLGERVGVTGDPAGDGADGRRRGSRRGCIRPLKAAAGPVAQAAVGHRMAAVGKLLAQLDDADLAVRLIDAPLQEEPVQVEAAGAGAASGDHVLPAGGASIPLDGVPPPAQVASDGTQPHPIAQQTVDQSVMSAHPLCAPAGREGERRRLDIAGTVGLRSGDCLAGLRGDGAQVAAVRGNALLDGLTEVLEQMKPISDEHARRGDLRVRQRHEPAQ